MSAASTIRHSFAGRCARRAIHLLYRCAHPGDGAVEYRLPGGVRISLYPEGEIAEFLAFQRLFERTELALVRAYLQPGMRVLDVGANIGLYSVMAAKLTGPAGTVWAFEPSPESFARLERNLDLNNCANVHPLRLALSDRRQGALELLADRGFGDAYRYLGVAPVRREQIAHSELVPVTTLDHWASSAGVRGVDFLKVDIEGGEYHMFSGAREFLRANPAVMILFESEADWCERAACRQEDTFELLQSLGFGVHAWNPRAGRWENGRAALLESGMIWACRDASRLPAL